MARESVRGATSSLESLGRSHGFRTGIKDFFNIAYTRETEYVFISVFKRHFPGLTKEKAVNIIEKDIPNIEVK